MADLLEEMYPLDHRRMGPGAAGPKHTSAPGPSPRPVGPLRPGSAAPTALDWNRDERAGHGSPPHCRPRGTPMSAQLARPVVVGVDGSRDGLVALTWAARFATARQAPLHGVHVVDESRHPAVPPSDCPDDGAEVLDDAADELERIGFAGATLEVRHGHPATILVGLSSRAEALVIGRRGAGGFAELVMGSTSQVCTALTRAPLVVVPDCWEPDRPRHGRIVVGVDGSPGCQAALAFGFDLAEATGAEVRVVHAADVPESYPVPGLWPDPNDN